jgi:ABC-type phosphate transport system permease subunit
MQASIYNRRRVTNTAVMALAWVAALGGIAILALILGTLFYKGFSGISLKIFMAACSTPSSAA